MAKRKTLDGACKNPCFLFFGVVGASYNADWELPDVGEMKYEMAHLVED
ncbi:MAG: hypothetical protein NT154_14130 [Verrucomicrobia bacterium]|nr:hypothetical protein [Verrucomicrobiota bacterium]